MDTKDIKKFISLLSKNPFLSEIEFEEEGKKIRLKRMEGSAPAFTVAAPPPQESAAAPVEVSPPKRDSGKTLLKIESPMVGTFYRSPAPTANSFVEVGDTIRKGKVVCIIEAMKLMNEIESDVDGKIVEILPQNGHPVEYGEPLFLLEPL